MAVMSKYNFFYPNKIKLSKKCQNAIQLDFDISTQIEINHVDYGMWYILPFAKILPFTDFGGNSTVGIRLIPNTSIQNCPVVACSSNKAVTVASSLSTALPMLIYRNQLCFSKYPFINFWPEIENELIDLHMMLGGTDSLEGLRSLLLDDSLFAKTEWIDVPDEIAYKSLSILDTTPEHLVFRKYVQDCIANKNEHLNKPENLEGWTNSAISTTFLNYQNSEFEKEKILSAWQVANLPASIDTPNTGKITHLPSQLENARQILIDSSRVLAANLDLIPNQWKIDPLWHPTMLINEDHRLCNGISHIEAAQQLDELGQPERAFDALISAAFWSYTNHKVAIITILEAAIYLAKKNNWADIVVALEDFFKLHKNRS
jgi:hypothetical protein